MPRTEKVERVTELKEQIEGSDALLLTEYRGLTVPEIGELRRSLRENGTSFAVVKNTLMKRAAIDAGVVELASLLSGPSAVAFVSGDVVAAAKAIRVASRQYPALVLKGGYLDGQLLDAEQATGLADLASREEMLSQVARLLKSDLARAARLLQAVQSRFLSLLDAYEAKLSAGGEGVTPVVPEDATDDAVGSVEPNMADGPTAAGAPDDEEE